MPLPRGRSPAVPLPGTVGHLSRGPVDPTAVLCPECRQPTIKIPAGFRVARRMDAADDVLETRCCGKTIRVPLEAA